MSDARLWGHVPEHEVEQFVNGADATSLDPRLAVVWSLCQYQDLEELVIDGIPRSFLLVLARQIKTRRWDSIVDLLVLPDDRLLAMRGSSRVSHGALERLDKWIRQRSEALGYRMGRAEVRAILRQLLAAQDRAT